MRDKLDDRTLALIGALEEPELLDVELEAALTEVGIYTYGPDAERFEKMFAAAIKCRAALLASKENDNG